MKLTTALALIAGISSSSPVNVKAAEAEPLLRGVHTTTFEKQAAEASSTATCGGTMTSYTTLTRDLVCQDGGGGEEAQECAVTLDGPDAVLDCGGFMVTQTHSPSASISAKDCPSISRSLTFAKKFCGLEYLSGICLLNGAKATNCHVQQFGQGINVYNGGEVTNSKVSSNNIGIIADDRIGDHVGDFDVSVSNTDLTDNTSGIYVFSDGNKCEVKLDGVIIKDNAGSGSYVRCGGGVIDMNNVDASNNQGMGVSLSSPLTSNTTPTMDLKLKGATKMNGNGRDGIGIDSFKGVDMKWKVEVEGDVELTLNEQAGLGARLIDEDASLEVDVKEGGSLALCDNGFFHGREVDILLMGYGSQAWTGEGLMCDQDKVIWKEPNVPKCGKACPSS